VASFTLGAFAIATVLLLTVVVMGGWFGD